MMTTVERNERTQRSGVVEVVWNLTPNASPIAGSPPAPPSPPPISAFGPSGEQAQEKRSTSSSKSNDTASQQPLHQQQQQQQQVLQRVSHLVHSIPIRIVALHYCVKEGGQQYQDASEEREEQAEVGQQSSATTSSDYDPSFILGHGDSYRFRSHVGAFFIVVLDQLGVLTTHLDSQTTFFFFFFFFFLSKVLRRNARNNSIRSESHGYFFL